MIRWRGSRSPQTPPNRISANQGERLRAEHEPEIGRRPRALGDEQRQGDDHDLVADRGGGLAVEQISEILVAQDAQIGTHRTLFTDESTGRKRGRCPQRAAAVKAAFLVRCRASPAERTTG
jgi:hypothetical protein